jgi:hypothetical protein
MHMAMKFLTVAAALAIGLAAPAVAANYEFQYLFNTGQLITGSFSGDQSGNLVTNISNLDFSIDGTPVTGSLYIYGFTGYNGPAGPNDPSFQNFVLNGAQLSFDPLLNNFLFRNAPVESATDEQFYIFPWSNFDNQVAAQLWQNGTANQLYNGSYIPQNWSLSQVNVPGAVPEPATWLMLLSGFGLVGAMARRRQVTVAA